MSNNAVSTIRASLKVPSSLDALSELVMWFGQLELSALDPQIILEAQTALIEAFTNAVRHAHAHLPAHTPINIQVLADDRVFQLSIWDQGPPYDFRAAMQCLDEAGECDLSPVHREEHWGQILFLRLSRDRGWRFSYDRLREQQNCFLMEKSFHASPA